MYLEKKRSILIALHTNLCTEVSELELLRIGDKVISRQQIDRWITRILDLRRQGYSQQDAARTLKIDRSFISRLESLGELRKGGGVAVVGFPVADAQSLEHICRKHGVDWWLLLSEEERLDFVGRDGLELFNEVMNILAALRNYDTVVVMGSNKRVQLIEGLLDRDVIPIILGESPLKHDVAVDLNEFEKIIQAVCG